jgi:hypothetical protein
LREELYPRFKGVLLIEGEIMTDDKNEKYVTLQMCTERSQRILDKLEVIDKRLTKIEEKQNQSVRDWKMFALSILSGTIVAIITWIIHLIR